MRLGRLVSCAFGDKPAIVFGEADPPHCVRPNGSMNKGDFVLTLLPQADGIIKNRPAVVLCRMPPFGDWLVCGITTQLHQQAAQFDELIGIRHFSNSGAIRVIRGPQTLPPACSFACHAVGSRGGGSVKPKKS